MACQVVHEGQLTCRFDVKTGVPQGCLLSPFLFLLTIDWVMRQTTDGQRDGIQWTLWTQLDDLDFADDLTLLSHNQQQMQNKTTSLASHASQVGLHIHPNKTKILKINASSREAVKLVDNNLEEVETFTYLGSVINQQGGTDADVKTRIGEARAAFMALKNIWRSNLNISHQNPPVQLQRQISPVWSRNVENNKDHHQKSSDQVKRVQIK